MTTGSPNTKAAALASYARQSNDDALQKHAIKIQSRAIERCGLLMKEIPSGQGSSNQHTELRGGSPPILTRTQAARDAGLSDDQRKTALRVAKVDDAEFEAAVESDDPPTVTQIAEAGIEHKPIMDPNFSEED